MADPDNGKLATDDDGIREECMDRLRLAIDADGHNHIEGLDDLNFMNGTQWDPVEEKKREIDQRPCMTINKIPTFVHQITNDQRQNVPSIKVSPVDSGADKEIAKVIQGGIRHIEYSSNADVAYDTAGNSAAQIGFGYFRLVTDFCGPASFDQELKFRRIRNSFTVYMDPGIEELDGSDQRWCIISGKMPSDEFRRDFPDASYSPQSLPRAAGDDKLADWLGDKWVRIAEYYRINDIPAVLCELSNGEIGYEKDLLEMPEGVTIVRRRDSYKRKIEWFKMTALDILERTEILSKWIPVFPVFGDELDIDGKVIRSGVIRNAKDPARMYNYWMTAATEEVALRTKTPYIGAAGQFEGYEEDWEVANIRSLPYLEYQPVVDEAGNPMPAPSRQPMVDIPEGFLRMAMHANDNIKATTGLFDSSLGAKGTATSGVQERAQQTQGNIANYHYSDNLHKTIRHAARVAVHMFTKYYDKDRIIRIMGDDGAMSSARINQQDPEPKVDDQGAAIDAILNDVTVGDYDVVVKAGPPYNTLRQEALEGMVETGGKWPKLWDAAGDLMIEAMDWPNAGKIAARIKRTIPAEITGPEDAQNDGTPMVQTPRGPIPLEQAGQMLAQMDTQMQQLAAENAEMKAGITKAKIDNEAKVHVAEINAVSKADVEEIKGQIALLLQKVQIPADLKQSAHEAMLKPDPSDGPSDDKGATG